MEKGEEDKFSSSLQTQVSFNGICLGSLPPASESFAKETCASRGEAGGPYPMWQCKRTPAPRQEPGERHLLACRRLAIR